VLTGSLGHSIDIIAPRFGFIVAHQTVLTSCSTWRLELLRRADAVAAPAQAEAASSGSAFYLKVVTAVKYYQ
jgi:hypothetical protein